MVRAKSEDKRHAILEAALELFVERHFHGTAIPMIAEKAGVADGTIYRYFKSKDELVNTLFIEKKREMTAYVTQPFAAGLGIKEKLVAIGVRFLEYAEKHPKTTQFLERNHHESYLGPEAQAAELPIIHFVMGLLEEGRAQGLIKKVNDAVLVFLLYGALNGMVEAQRRGVIPSLRAVQGDVEECLWHAIRA
ncbi:MAG: TetR/AcrR family transcriptional regulator [Deltaproteobacteria bacterium]|nr:TetR/AcrR family transcriptional regulator [Deltaproteobacteria bacterium]